PPASTGITSSAFRANACQRTQSSGSLRCRLTTSIIAQGRRLLTLDFTLPGLRLVSLDDHLYQLVTHDVLFVEVDEFNAFDISQYAFGLHQAAPFSGGQINLRYVAGNNRLRAETNAREKHLHLLAGRVLRFIQNNKGIGERAAAHEGQRRD